MDSIYHYPPELFRLLVETLPKLCKTKKDLLQFFRGADVDRTILSSHENLLATNKDTFNKYTVTGEIATRLNDLGERTPRECREILKRIVVVLY
jgi:restriction system protein